MKVIRDVENSDKFYLQLPDGYRLIYELSHADQGTICGEYVGRYNPELNTVI